MATKEGSGSDSCRSRGNKKLCCLKHSAELVAVATKAAEAMAAVQMREQRRCRSCRNETGTEESVAVLATAVGSNEEVIRSGSEGRGRKEDSVDEKVELAIAGVLLVAKAVGGDPGQVWRWRQNSVRAATSFSAAAMAESAGLQSIEDGCCGEGCAGCKMRQKGSRRVEKIVHCLLDVKGWKRRQLLCWN